jgi:hypothetical protein
MSPIFVLSIQVKLGLLIRLLYCTEIICFHQIRWVNEKENVTTISVDIKIHTKSRMLQLSLLLPLSNFQSRDKIYNIKFTNLNTKWINLNNIKFTNLNNISSFHQSVFPPLFYLSFNFCPSPISQYASPLSQYLSLSDSPALSLSLSLLFKLINLILKLVSLVYIHVI